MTNSIKTVLAAAVFAVPSLLATAIPADAADSVVARSLEEKGGFLSMVCADFNMLTRQGQRYCLQEMYGQSLEFAQEFFAAMHINASNKMQRIKEWRTKVGLDHPAALTDEQKTQAEVGVLYMIGYGRTCQQLSDTILDPDQLLGMSDITVDTIVGLPEYCVEQAVNVARTFELDIDFNEATQLSESIGKVRDYYEASPVIPAPRAGKKIELPDPV